MKWAALQCLTEYKLLGNKSYTSVYFKKMNNNL